MNIKNILIAVLAVVLSTGCNGQNKNNAETRRGTSLQNEQTSNSGNMSKSIVIFFSHAGDNYSVGIIDTGNTKIVADYISEITGADQFEIVTHKYDGMAYTPLIELAKKEAAAGELPPYEGTAPDLSQYDTVFIGGPVWWGTYPQVMFTLFKDINLDGKTVIPFTTHEGSGLASCVSDIKKAFPKAKITGEFSIYGHEVRTGRAKVEKWLKNIVKI
ncbi:MAG: flavodoxin [Bacteroidales bacterium]|nr:flavodoxin [Bacteroidales bacterium]